MGFGQGTYVVNDFHKGDRIVIDGQWRGTVQESRHKDTWPIDVELVVLMDGVENMGMVYPNVAHIDWIMPGEDPRCSYCGESFPVPVELHHSERECRG